MDEQQRPGGTYGFNRTIRWADGRTDRSSWSERLTAEEATERMGPVAVMPDAYVLRPLVWTRLPGSDVEVCIHGDSAAQNVTIHPGASLVEVMDELPGDTPLSVRRVPR